MQQNRLINKINLAREVKSMDKDKAVKEMDFRELTKEVQRLTDNPTWKDFEPLRKMYKELEEGLNGRPQICQLFKVKLPEPKSILSEAAYTGGDVPKKWINDRGNYIDEYNHALQQVKEALEKAGVECIES